MGIDEIKESFVGNILFPFSNLLLNRGKILPMYREFLRFERYSGEQIREIQLKKMQGVISNVHRWIPYYKKKFRQIGLEPGDIKDIEDIKAIPPLSRQDVIEHYRDLVDLRLQAAVKITEKQKRGPGEPVPFALFRRRRIVRNTSSGSTGAPTVFYEDGSITAVNWANELRIRNWYGINPGAKEARMVRISLDYIPGNKTLLMRKYLWNQLILPGINLSDEDYEYCYRKIEEFRPRVLWGFTSALTGLAEYICKEDKRISKNKPMLVITWAAPLYDHEKRILTEVFCCPVTNIYSAREVGHIAAICPHGSLHINQESLLVETVNDEVNDTDNGSGEIVVTTLQDTPMPFIRYRMGDIGKVKESRCGCGRSLHVLKDFLGRTGEIFITKDGRMISPNFWCRTFMDRHLSGAVKRFQIIYESPDSMKIRIVKGAAYTEKTEENLRTHLRNNFHTSMKTQFEYVGQIDPQVSGKYQMVINNSVSTAGHSCN